MIEELDELMKFYDNDNSVISNYWYDEGIEEANEILQKFTDDEWNRLILSLPSRSVIWKKRFVYCLTDTNNMNHLKALLSIIKTDNEELFCIAISFLNQFDLKDIPEKEEILNRINELLPITNSKISEMVYNTFLERNGRAR